MPQDLTSSRWSSLSPAKRLLLEKRMRREVAGPSEARRVRRRGDAGPAPLSAGQRRLWVLQQMEPENAAYNIARSLRLRGRLSPAVLEQALSETARRHESLRTTFPAPTGEPVQVVAPARPGRLPLVDLSGLSEGEAAAQVLRLSRLEARRPFNLVEGPMLRACLLRLAPDDWVLLLTLHHIISDAFSAEILVREVGTLLTATAGGRPSPLAELPIQYADFARWQSEWLRGEEFARQLAYWRERLAGPPAVLELPLDRPRPPVRSWRGATRSLALHEGLAAALRELSRRVGVTPFIALLAAFKTLLYRYTGQADICVGTVAATRANPETAPLIGYFADTLVLRTGLSGDLTFAGLLGRVREVFAGAYDHRDISFERLVQELQPGRDLSHTPLFHVAFTLRSLPPAAHAPEGPLTQSLLPSDRGTSRYDLSLLLVEQGDSLRAVLEYSTDLFEGPTAGRMLRHYGRLLEAAVGEPAAKLSSLPLISDAERHQLLREWNDSARAATPPATLYGPAEDEARRRPDAVALVSEDSHLTYGELAARAAGLARRLRALGVGPEVAVGVLAERSAEMVVGLCGVLKAGGAYVPLDPTYPRARLEAMMEDAGVSVVVAHRRLTGQLPHGSGIRCVLLDEGPARGAAGPGPPPPACTPSNAAYTIFTSGSTGRPKGVVCTHAGASNLIAHFARLAPLGPGSRCSFWTSLSFDVSVYEIFTALHAGATLQVVPEAVRSDFALYASWLAQHMVEGAFIPPAMVAEFAAALGGGGVRSSLRRLLVGVEPLPEQTLAAIAGAVPGLRVINGYGPTEASIVATTFHGGLLKRGPRTTPIGRAVADTQVYLLDGGLEPVPAGVAGELYLGGAGLARGYAGRAELTAERFVPDPFSPEPGARLYRTGDLGRYLPDGQVEFAGRADRQVKVRGFRVEPGEVEAVLAAHPSVREAAVTVHDGETTGRRLVGYVVPRQPGGVTAVELRAHLKGKLPEHMVPSAFVLLEGMPRTPAGKPDRRALPAPGAERPELVAAYVAPRGRLEGEIARVWGELLKVARVGADDNFFDLGGHSLLIIRAHRRLQDDLGMQFSVIDMFQHPTVSALAHYLAGKEAGAEAAPPPAAGREGKLEDGKRRLRMMQRARRAETGGEADGSR